MTFKLFLISMLLIAPLYAEKGARGHQDDNEMPRNTKGFEEELNRFKKQIDGLVNKLDANKPKDRKDARDELKELLNEKLIHEKRTALLEKLKTAAGKSAEVQNFLNKVQPDMVDWKAVVADVKKDLEAHARLKKYGEVLDLVLSKVSAAERDRLLTLMDEGDALKFKLATLTESLVGPFRDAVLEDKKYEMDEVLMGRIKRLAARQDEVDRAKTQLLAKVLKAQGFEIAETTIPRDATTDLLLGEDEIPANRKQQVKDFEKKLADTVSPQHVVILTKGGEKFQLQAKNEGFIEVSQPEAKDFIVPLKSFQGNALPNNIAAKNLKKIPLEMSLAGNFESPIYIAGFTYDGEFNDPDTGEPNGKSRKIIAEQFAPPVIGNILKKQFTDPKSKIAIDENTIVGDPSDADEDPTRNLNNFITVRSQRSNMKHVKLDPAKFPVKPNAGGEGGSEDGGGPGPGGPGPGGVVPPKVIPQ